MDSGTQEASDKKAKERPGGYTCQTHGRNKGVPTDQWRQQ